jgi:hypothetical protein
VETPPKETIVTTDISSVIIDPNNKIEEVQEKSLDTEIDALEPSTSP